MKLKGETTNSTSTIDKLKATRKAFTAYERALQAAQEALKEPERGLGTTRHQQGAMNVDRQPPSPIEEATMPHKILPHPSGADSVVKVGDGRGFIVEHRVKLPFVRRKSRQFQATDLQGVPRGTHCGL